jgi:integrase
MGKLTALAFRNATKPGKYQDGDGLFLLVKPSGARSWLLRAQVDGKRREFGIGPAADIGLAEARERAAAIRKQYRDGIDPVAAKRAARSALREIPTFKGAAETVHGERKGGWRNPKHRDQWLSSLDTYAFPSLGTVRVDQVDAPTIRAALLPIWLEKPETARRVSQRIGTVLDWAHANGFRPQEAPMRSVLMGLPRQPRRDRHFAAMPFADVPTFCIGLEAGAPTAGRLGLLFTIYTATRSGEVRGATWAEIDLEAKVWTVPASRMKADREHVVPLSPAALAVLERAAAIRKSKKGDAMLFPSAAGRALSDMTLSKVLRDAGQAITVHGFRSAFKDWASEQTTFPDAVSEAALAHGDPDKVRKAYRRTDFLQLRRELMEAWAAFIAGPSGNVVAFPARNANGAA